MLGSTSTYERSNARLALPHSVSRASSFHIHQLLVVDTDPAVRQEMGQRVCDSLCRDFGLPPCEIIVADRRQLRRHDGVRLQSKTYGYYRCWMENRKVTRSRIRIYHKTAVREQVISPKVFVNTLLHEWTHHLDYSGLKLGGSPHTKGFYARLADLVEQSGIHHTS